MDAKLQKNETKITELYSRTARHVSQRPYVCVDIGRVLVDNALSLEHLIGLVDFGLVWQALCPAEQNFNASQLDPIGCLISQILGIQFGFSGDCSLWDGHSEPLPLATPV
jgi:hypothetical protein